MNHYLSTHPHVRLLISLLKQSYTNTPTTYKGVSNVTTHHHKQDMVIGTVPLKWKLGGMKQNTRVLFGNNLNKHSNMII